MVSSKGWRESQLSTALSSVVGESCILNSTPPAPTWLLGTILKGGFSHDSEGKEDPGYPGERYSRRRYRFPRGEAVAAFRR